IVSDPTEQRAMPPPAAGAPETERQLQIRAGLVDARSPEDERVRVIRRREDRAEPWRHADREVSTRVIADQPGAPLQPDDPSCELVPRAKLEDAPARP